MGKEIQERLTQIMAKLFLLTLPIGNMEDLSQRGRQSLTHGKHFFVEDTRVFIDRVKRAEIDLKAESLFAFHDQDRSKDIKAIELLESGEDVYIASDAGSPLISDPAFPLVRLAIEKGFEIDVLPGPNSVITALELSGLPPHPFQFHGFLTKENSKKESIFESCAGLAGTHIFFESPHRILETTDVLCETLSEVDVCLAKELTKTFQTLHRFSAKEWASKKSEVVNKGEFVLLFHVKDGAKASGKKIVSLAEDVLKKPNNKKLSKLLSEILGEGAKDIYSQLEGNSRNSD